MVLSQRSGPLAILLVLVCAVVLRNSLEDLLFFSAQIEPVAVVKKVSTSLSFPKDRIRHTLYPGELPGYTGWARPANTLAGSFSLREYESTARVGAPWTLKVYCNHTSGLKGGSLFYVRAYGPAVLTGTVQDHYNGSYTVTFYPFDAGHYTVELVLSFSNHHSWREYPIEHEEPYEGYLLPDFPLQMVAMLADSQVQNTTSSDENLPICGLHDLQRAAESPLTTGRWVVTNKNAERESVVDSNTPQAKDILKDYQLGKMSLGVAMDYQPVACSLITDRNAKSRKTLESCLKLGRRDNTTSSHKKPHVIFIGDSNFRLQQAMFDQFFGGKLATTRITTEGGIVAKLPDIRKSLNNLAKDNDREYFVLFNTGLHDLDKMCQKSWHEFRAKLIPNISEADFSCLDQYEASVTDFVKAVAAFPARLRVWETTTAGWSKWGNFGVAWPADKWQRLPTDPTAVAVLNEVAAKILEPFTDSIIVQDGYWISLARPDHKESNSVNAIGGHLVHSGPGVYSILMRMWAMMIMHVLCPRSVDD